MIHVRENHDKVDQTLVSASSGSFVCCDREGGETITLADLNSPDVPAVPGLPVGKFGV